MKINILWHVYIHIHINININIFININININNKLNLNLNKKTLKLKPNLKKKIQTYYTRRHTYQSYAPDSLILRPHSQIMRVKFGANIWGKVSHGSLCAHAPILPTYFGASYQHHLSSYLVLITSRKQSIGTESGILVILSKT